MILHNILLLIFYQLILIYERCWAIKINSVGLVYEDNESYTPMAKIWNDYAKENGIDIELLVTTYSVANSSLNVDNFGMSMEYLLKKETKKYDIFFYDTMYSRRYSPYFLDLKEYLPKEHMKLYSNGIAPQICTYDGKWVGLPINSGYDVLYSNIPLLEKHGKEVPKTWDELIDTALYIIEKEKEEGNENIVGYNGLFPDYETCVSSTQEFIYSYRKSVDSPYPEYTSEEAVNALNKIKEIMNKISSKTMYLANEGESIMNLFMGKALFAKFWKLPIVEGLYKQTRLPGVKDGISASTLGGSNIGINKYISEDKRKAALQIVEYLTSYDVQKNYSIEKKVLPTIESLFFDLEVCKAVDCELGRSLQPIARPGSLTENYDEYAFKVKNYLHEFYYGDKDAAEVLNKINDLTKIYHIALDSSTTSGLIVFIVTIVIALFIVSSYACLFVEKQKIFFEYLNTKSWTMIFIGFILGLLTIPTTQLGEIENYKCTLNFTLISFSFNLIFIPILHQLIVNFPDKTKSMMWIESNKSTFFITVYSLDVVLNSLLFISSFEAEVVASDDIKNFKTCAIRHVFGKVIMILILLEKGVIMGSLGLLVFAEWNLKSVTKDVRFITGALYMNLLIVILVFIKNFININNYEHYFTFYSVLTLLYVCMNYFFVYGVKLIYMKIGKEKIMEMIEKKVEMQKFAFNSSSKATSSKFSSSDNGNINKSKPLMNSRIMKCHYSSGDDSSNGNIYSSMNKSSNDAMNRSCNDANLKV